MESYKQALRDGPLATFSTCFRHLRHIHMPTGRGEDSLP